MAELLGKSTRGTASGPSQKVTAMKTADSSGEQAKDIVTGVTSAAKGQVESDARQNALDVQGDQSLADVNKVVIDEVDAKISGAFGAPDVEAVNIMRDNNTISQREFEEARDNVFSDTIKTVQQVKQAMALNKMTKKEGDAMLNRFYRQNTSSVFGSLFREDIAKGISSVTGNTGRSPTTDLEMSTDDIQRKATEEALAKKQAETAVQVEVVKSAIPGITQEAAEDMVQATEAQAYKIKQAKAQSASAALVSSAESNQLYVSSVGILHRMSDPVTGTITPQNIQLAGNRLTFQHAQILSRARTQGEDTTKLKQQQAAEMASFNTIAKSMSDAEFQKNLATYNSSQASNYLWETNSQLAYLSEVMGPSFDVMNVDMNKVAYFSLLANPGMADNLGITLAPAYSSAKNNFVGVKDGKPTKYTANEVVEIATAMRKNRYNAAVAMEGQPAADKYAGGQQEPKENRKGAAVVMAGQNGENLEQVYNKVVETNGQPYMNKLIDENDLVATSYIDRPAVKNAAPGAVNIAVNTVNVLTAQNSRMMTTLREVAPDAKIGFADKPNAVAETYGVDTPSRQLEIQNVPEGMVGTEQFKAVSGQIQDIYRALKNQPSLWAGTYSNLEDAVDAIFTGAFIEPTVALKTATDLKNGTADFQVITQKGMPVVIRNTAVIPPDETVPPADVPLPEGGARGVAEKDVGKVEKNTADTGTRLNPDGTPALDQGLTQAEADSLKANFDDILNNTTDAELSEKFDMLVKQAEEIRARKRLPMAPARIDPEGLAKLQEKQKVPVSVGKSDEVPFPTTGNELDVAKLRELSDGKATTGGEPDIYERTRQEENSIKKGFYKDKNGVEMVKPYILKVKGKPKGKEYEVDRGYGDLIKAGLSKKEAEALLKKTPDVTEAEARATSAAKIDKRIEEINKKVGDKLPARKKEALAEMLYQGGSKMDVTKWKNTYESLLNAIEFDEPEDWKLVQQNMLASNWAVQTPERAKRVVKSMFPSTTDAELESWRRKKAR